MKKLKVLALFLCMAFCTFFFTACGSNLTAPNGTAEMAKHGEVLVYDDYIYFGGMYISNADMVDGDNKNADLEGLWRIKLEDGKISYDEDGNVQGLEKVLGKVVGTENAFMYAVGDQIVFASPNVHKTNQSQTAFDRTSYFKINDFAASFSAFPLSIPTPRANLLPIDTVHTYFFSCSGPKLSKTL